MSEEVFDPTKQYGMMADEKSYSQLLDMARVLVEFIPPEHQPNVKWFYHVPGYPNGEPGFYIGWKWSPH